MSDNYKLDSPNAWVHGSTDAIPPCPNCYVNTNQTVMGQIVVDGSPRPAYKCGSCNRMYSDLPAPVKVLADAAVNKGAKSIGFVANGSTSADSTTVNYVNQTNVNDHQETQNNLRTINSSVQNLMYTIQTMAEEIKRIAQQNHDLMDKLANDPLAHVRKAVTEFNLE